ncbi:hypothetical protein [Fredinandcohnia sp. 179-A 10B2 NHS]|uniref:hypothetical protein n=1 Tax=Fredinandcohnia sp. 179-A 10B2 NHS TaxID=3235176 RepID=UPI00399F2636
MVKRSFLVKYISVVAILLSLVMLFVYIFDPLSFYRFSSFYEKQYSTEARFQIPGFVKNSEYDTLIVGTSMGRNFVESYVDEKLGGKSLNATLPAGTAKEQSLTASLGLREKKVKRIIWEINHYSIQGGSEFVLNEPNKFPFYLYDRNPLNDYKYLLNSFSFSLIKTNLIANLKHVDVNRDREMLFKFGNGVEPAKIENLPFGFGPKEPNNKKPEEEYRYDSMMESFSDNMLSLVKENPDVEFIFFYAPYPILTHINKFNDSTPEFEERIKVKEDIYNLVQDYDNVKIYDFQADREITHNLSNYMSDWTHYYMFINEYIIDQIAEGQPIASIEEYKKLNEELYDQVLNFSVDNLKEFEYQRANAE